MTIIILVEIPPEVKFIGKWSILAQISATSLFVHFWESFPSPGSRPEVGKGSGFVFKNRLHMSSDADFHSALAEQKHAARAGQRFGTERLGHGTEWSYHVTDTHSEVPTMVHLFSLGTEGDKHTQTHTVRARSPPTHSPDNTLCMYILGERGDIH